MEQIGIGPGAAAQGVGALATHQGIGTGTAEQPVVAAGAIELVIAGAADQPVIAQAGAVIGINIAAIEDIVAAAAEQAIIAGPAQDHLAVIGLAGPPAFNMADGELGVVGEAEVINPQGRIPPVVEDDAVAGAGGIGAGAGQADGEIAAIPLDHDVFNTDAGAEADRVAALGITQHGVDAVAAMEQIGISPGAAAQGVGALAAFQDVVAGAANHVVRTTAPGEPIAASISYESIACLIAKNIFNAEYFRATTGIVCAGAEIDVIGIKLTNVFEIQGIAAATAIETVEQIQNGVTLWGANVNNVIEGRADNVLDTGQAIAFGIPARALAGRQIHRDAS